ncbi:hypothetical protein PLICRDRAFT_175636 [Plicaturopsis crispa FD-325 SS-3]|nr:hypothetical protein PLICRDRAFT_175636 [Plicaturopsis crispa FD-325 SS-3]
MDLTLLKSNTRNTVLTDPEGAPVYIVTTPTGLFTNHDTTIRRVDGPKERDIGRVQSAGFSQSWAVAVHGRDVRMIRSGAFSASESFMASDGKMYKWKIKGGAPLRVRKGSDGLNTNIAVYSGASGLFCSRPSILTVSPDGLAILDELVATFIYMETRRKDDEQ